MIANGFQSDAFVRNANAIARLVLPNELFSFLMRQVTVPASCVALIWTDSSRPTFVPGGRVIDSEGVGEVLFAKTLPFQLEFDSLSVPSKDGYDFAATVTLSVQIVPQRDELELLRREVMGSRNRAEIADLQRHCEEAVCTALAEFAKSKNAAELVSPDKWDSFDEVLSGHFQPLGFASGLALGRDVRASFLSAAYDEHHRAEQAAARRRDRQSADEQLRAATNAARTQHLEQLAGLLERAKTAAAQAPGLSVAELAKSFDLSQRGEVYRGLLAVGKSSPRTDAILVVAGQELLRFEPPRFDQPARRQAVPDDLGPLRSVRVVRRLILVGARYGVHVFDDAGDARQAYPFANRPDLRGGVNAATILSDRFYASHSEVGLTCWELGKPSSPAACLEEQTRGCKSVRDVQVDDAGRIWFAADARVIGWPPASNEPPLVLESPGAVQSLVVADDWAFAGLDNGAIVRWPAELHADMEEIRPAGDDAVYSVEWLVGGGIPRLLIADRRSFLTLQVLGDSFRAEYRAKHPLRWGFAAEDVIVGVSDARDQLTVWRADLPDEQMASISIGHLTGHSIQDVALMSCPSVTPLVIG